MTCGQTDGACPARDCLGLPLDAALALCRARGMTPDIIYSGERAAGEGLTPRVIALREGALVVALFRDGDPALEET
ncbi:MAG: hypothetical protein IJS53_03120 [Clostridia bacterium]|nr:hypothetical protein [Clostridia bacterium]